MNEIEIILASLLGLMALALVGVSVALVRTRTTLSLTRQRLQLIEDSRATMTDLLRAQAAQSAQDVADQMVHRATEAFQAQDRQARERMEAQLKPVAETLVRFQTQVAELEKARATETGGLKEQIALLMTASNQTRNEARRLTEALKGNTGRRGRWGEQTCRNVLEAAGMAGRFDFVEQTTGTDEDGRRQRPDFLVRMPGGGLFVIDAKVPLAFEDDDIGDEETRRQAQGVRTATSLKTHLRQLASKAYQDQFQPSPDFVVLFVPGDAFLATALDHEPDLLSDAMGQRVVIATPSTLFALCKAVAYGWRAEEQSKNAEDIAKLGKELYRRLATMGSHAAAVGKALDAAVGRYNQFVGSLESQVMVQARRFEDLKVDHEGKSLDALAPVEAAPRRLSRPELTGPSRATDTDAA